MRHLLALALSLAPLPAFAALSPFYDSAERIGTILGNATVADTLRQAPLRSIENTGTREDGASEWTIRTQDCDLVVYLVPKLPEAIGKTTYEIEFTTPCP